MGLISIGYPLSSVVVKLLIASFSYSALSCSLCTGKPVKNFVCVKALENRRLSFRLDKLFAAASSAF